ncbi:DUF5590 domain-containing protein [Bacillus daqingensis]|uniref:DUF5590 domain-containing protein n=1 Tax=Bacillus daqingensis TaxID=872396 RepID=A0ABV9NSI8_9BACI
MKKLLMILGLAGTAAVGVTVYAVLNSALNPLEERQALAAEAAEEEYELQEIREIEYFHGAVSYQVIDAVDASGEDVYVFVEDPLPEEEEAAEELDEADNEAGEQEEPAEGEERDIIVLNKNDGIAQDEAVSIAASDADISRFISVKPGFISDTAVYEVRYRDSEGRFGYYYVSFEDGDYLRRYELSPRISR